MRSNRPKRQPTHQARHPGNTRPKRQESKTQARRAALRNKTPKPSPKKAPGRKGARAGTHTQTHTTSQTSTRNLVAANARQRRSEVMALHRRPVAALTTLSYASKPTTSIQFYRVPPAGIEPATRRLKVGCSNQLSYRGVSSPGPLARAHARNASGGTIRAAVCEGIQRPACLHYQTASIIVK